MEGSAASADDGALTWDLSCPDWRERLRQRRSLVPPLPIDKRAGERAVRVFNKLRLADVPGTPAMGEAGGDWFRDVVRALFGSIDPITRERRIRELFLLVAKKNSKTTNGALLMLTALLLNERPNAPMGMSAPVQDVAEIAFNAAAGAIALDPVLEKKLHVREHLKTIVHRETKASLQIMTFDPASLTGPKWAAFLVDELHVVAKMSKASSAIRQIRGGMLPYPEAFLAFITTQSEEAPAGVFRDELHKARRIRDGKAVGAMLPVLYEFPPEIQQDPDAWRDPVNWPQVTPNAGRSITIARLEQEFAASQGTSDEELRAWASQHLNVEIGLALQSGGWAGAKFWESSGDKKLTFEELLKRSEVVTLGVDGGGLDDMLALSAIGREPGTGKWLHWAHSWIHPIVLERRKKEAERFRDFERDGDLTIVKQLGDDVKELVAFIEKVEKAELLDRVGVDRHGISSIVEAIVALGIQADRIVGIPQGWQLQGPIKTTERKLAAGEMVHGDSPLMAWSVGNAKVEAKGNAIMITKQIAGSAKIDALMATFDAAALMGMNPKPRKKRYELFFA